MKIILLTALPVFVCLFWCIQIGCEVAMRRTRPLLWLFVFMCTSTVLYGGHFLFFNHVSASLTLSDTLYSAANLAVYPLYLLYIRSLTSRSNSMWPYWVALLPAILGGVAVACVYLLMDDAETTEFVDSYLYAGHKVMSSSMAQLQVYVHQACKVFFGLLIIPVFVLGRKYIDDYDQEVLAEYSDTEGKTLRIMHFMLVIFAVTSFASFVSNFLGRRLFADSPGLMSIPAFLYSSLLYAIGYLGCKQQFSISNIVQDEKSYASKPYYGGNQLETEVAQQSISSVEHEADTHESDTAAVLPDTSSTAGSHPQGVQPSDLRERIERVMRGEQLFLNPNLKLNDLVVRVGSNRNYVYNAINREMSVSFNEYVNRMRVEYAVSLMNDQPNLFLTEVGERSGFASDTSFYRNFKLYMGCSPKDYHCTITKG